jgi:protein phosphatase
VVWVLLIAALVGGGYGGVRAWSNRSYYVGFADNRVAIFRGLPVSFAGVHLSHVQESTQIKRNDVVQYFQDRLTDGIRVPSLAKAREFVADSIPLTPAAQASLRPAASPKPSPKASAT